MTEYKIEVTGLDKLLRSMYRVDRVVARSLQQELKVIAEDVAVRTRHYIIGRGLYDPERAPSATTGTAGAGPMVDKVSIQVSGGRVWVVERQARRSRGYPGGYSYPRRYEYESGGARSFMRPAVQAEKAVLTAKLEVWWASVLARAGW